LEIPLLALIIFGVATLLVLFWLYSKVTEDGNGMAVAPLNIPGPSEPTIVHQEEISPSTGIGADPIPNPVGNSIAQAVPENTEAQLEEGPVPAPR